MKSQKRASAFSVFKKKRKLEDVDNDANKLQNVEIKKKAKKHNTMSASFVGEGESSVHLNGKNHKSMKRFNSEEIIPEKSVISENIPPAPVFGIPKKLSPPKHVKFSERNHIINEGAEQHDEIINMTESNLSFVSNSTLEAKSCFDWLIYPVKAEKFFCDLWEKKPLLLKRHQKLYYKGIFSCKDFDRILKENQLYFTTNIDITSYINGKRHTLNPDGRVYSSVVWRYYHRGCSVRLLNPQTYSRNIWKLCSFLQEYFGSFTGSNMYLTPPGTQGFAPHYDDIEAFILQLEGKKLWKVYNPRTPSEVLPRFSSTNFSEKDLGDPVLTVELQPGDLLYFPRGYIHQASTSGDAHSLHITLSTCQRNTWGDFMEKMIPRALQMAFEEDLNYRESLPKNYMLYMGVANSDVDCQERDNFFKKLRHLVSKLMNHLPVDAAADQMAKDYIQDCLPPILSEGEKSRSIHSNSHTWEMESEDKMQLKMHMQPYTEIKLIRQKAIRLVMEEEGVRIYHTFGNSRVYHEIESQSLEIGAELAPAIEHLMHSFPNYTSVEDLPLEYLEEKLNVSTLLYENGLIMTKEPFQKS